MKHLFINSVKGLSAATDIQYESSEPFSILVWGDEELEVVGPHGLMYILELTANEFETLERLVAIEIMNRFEYWPEDRQKALEEIQKKLFRKMRA